MLIDVFLLNPHKFFFCAMEPCVPPPPPDHRQPPPPPFVTNGTIYLIVLFFQKIYLNTTLLLTIETALRGPCMCHPLRPRHEHIHVDAGGEGNNPVTMDANRGLYRQWCSWVWQSSAGLARYNRGGGLTLVRDTTRKSYASACSCISKIIHIFWILRPPWLVFNGHAQRACL